MNQDQYTFQDFEEKYILENNITDLSDPEYYLKQWFLSLETIGKAKAQNCLKENNLKRV